MQPERPETNYYMVATVNVLLLYDCTWWTKHTGAQHHQYALMVETSQCSKRSVTHYVLFDTGNEVQTHGMVDICVA